MMKVKYIHKEGWKIIMTLLVSLFLVNYLTLGVLEWTGFWGHFILYVSVALFLFVTYFFRNPARNIITDDNCIIAPADGKIVVVEEVEMDEYFDDRRLQVSIFMSPSNVHVNRTPIKGEVKYAKYHPGRYLVAWHPKSSAENERTSIVIDNGSFDVMMRQIAGKVARRIVYNIEEGDIVEQGADFGFIKFGSRVDLFLPIGTQVHVKLGQKVKGGETVIGILKEQPSFFEGLVDNIRHEFEGLTEEH